MFGCVPLARFFFFSPPSFSGKNEKRGIHWMCFIVCCLLSAYSLTLESFGFIIVRLLPHGWKWNSTRFFICLSAVCRHSSASSDIFHSSSESDARAIVEPVCEFIIQLIRLFSIRTGRAIFVGPITAFSFDSLCVCWHRDESRSSGDNSTFSVDWIWISLSEAVERNIKKKKLTQRIIWISLTDEKAARDLSGTWRFANFCTFLRQTHFLARHAVRKIFKSLSALFKANRFAEVGNCSRRP